jgi:transcriptional regulator with XRE-family HTH domain
MIIGEKLKKLRLDKGWSQPEVAKRLGIHTQHISRYERGISNPLASQVKKMADIFGVSADYLLSDELDDTTSPKIKDRELQRLFEDADKLPETDRQVIKRVIESILMNHQSTK